MMPFYTWICGCGASGAFNRRIFSCPICRVKIGQDDDGDVLGGEVHATEGVSSIVKLADDDEPEPQLLLPLTFSVWVTESPWLPIYATCSPVGEGLQVVVTLHGVATKVCTLLVRRDVLDSVTSILDGAEKKSPPPAREGPNQ